MLGQNIVLLVFCMCLSMLELATASVKKDNLAYPREFHYHSQDVDRLQHMDRQPNVPGQQLPSEDWQLVNDWPAKGLSWGQVSGVSLDRHGNVYVFHRGDRVWNMDTFSATNLYMERSRGTIAQSTLAVLNSTSGSIRMSWGQHMFYLPHGVTVDTADNVWLTDVALHQVFKFAPVASSPTSPLLTLGKAFTPGSNANHFCKPTAVAVLESGDFFVSDGYCNSRILKFDHTGTKILEWGRSNLYHGMYKPPEYLFSVPHALTLAEDKGLLCVADREDGRVQCFYSLNGTFAYELSDPRIGSRLFSVAYSPAQGGVFAVVNGPESFRVQFPQPVRGFTIASTPSHQLISQFGTHLQNPHDIAFSPDGLQIYVAEIGPFAVWKFTKNGSTDAIASELHPKQDSITQVNLMGGSLGESSGVLGAAVITGAALVFAGSIMAAAIIFSHNRRSAGCGRCRGSRGWMLGRSPTEGFKLGNLLGQHQGFEKLSTAEESEEEQPYA